MVRIYYSPSCASCRKVKQWFDDHNIPYESVDIFSSALKESDIKDMIVKSIDGTDEIISPRSKIVLENNIDFDSMTISELISFIKKNPSVLRRPIIVDDRRLQVGYNAEEIRTFMPRLRKLADDNCQPGKCPHYGECLPSRDHLGLIKKDQGA